MATTDAGDDVLEQWNRMVDQMNDTVAKSVEQNIKAQASFVESWADAMEGSMPEEQALSEGFEAYSNAYEIWMESADELFERSRQASDGEAVPIEAFRDIWLQTANEAFKEVMSTSAFAAATGDVVESMLELQRESQTVSQDALAQMGIATQSELAEVATRLVEIERRQHSIEQKLDTIIQQRE